MSKRIRTLVPKSLFDFHSRGLDRNRVSGKTAECQINASTVAQILKTPILSRRRRFQP